jgi:predicted alpha/beta superfamily hydrolase
MSSSFWWDDENFNTNVLVQTPPPAKRGLQSMFYLDSGDSGPSNDDVKQTQRVLGHMQSLGLSLNETLFYYLDQGGQHNEYFWGKRFNVPMQYLYPVSETPLVTITALVTQKGLPQQSQAQPNHD